jgi:hypothetical protein
MVLSVKGPDGWFDVVVKAVTPESSVVAVSSAWEDTLLAGLRVTSRGRTQWY